MSTQNYLLTIVLLWLIPIVSWSQRSFLDVLNSYETWDNHAITSTPDNGFIIGNDLKFPPEDWERHGFYLSKYDSCGLIEWAKAYGSPNQALYFTDLTGLPSGEAIAMGQTGFDDLFLMRIDASGAVVNIFTFDTSNGDQNYNIDFQDGKVMVFGSFYADNGARNFLLVVTEDGQIDWARSYHNRLGPGAATYCDDGSFICVNGNVVYKVNEAGNLEWSQQISSLSADGANLSRPVESGNGYVLAVRNPTLATQHLIKLNRSGQIQWQSDQIPSGFLASSIDRLSDDHLVMVNAQPENDEGLDGGAPFLAEFSPEGALLGQYAFDLESLGRFTPPICRAGANRSVTIKGAFYELGNYDYVIRLKPGEDLSCAGIAYDEVIQEKAALELRSLHTPVSNLNFTSSDTTEVTVLDLTFPTERFCEPTVDMGAMEFADTLACVDTVTFRSPLENATYLWKDGSTAAVRLLQAPGQYTVKATTCRTEFDMTIQLKLDICPCNYYIPNAFSPNGDGVNDLFQAFATCAFSNYELQIFDRWGEMLHRTQITEDGWDGTSGGRLVPQGVYMYALKYSWEIYPGVIRDEIKTGSITVVR